MELERLADYAIQARAHLERGEYQQSLEYLSLIESVKNLNDDLIVMKAINLQKLGKGGEAVKILENAKQIFPESKKIQLHLASNYFYQSNYLASMRTVREMGPAHMYNLPAGKILLKTYLKLSENKKASILSTTLLNKQPADLDLHFYRGLSLFRLKNYRESAEDFKYCFTHDFKTEKVAKYLAYIHTAQKNVAEANIYVRYLALKLPQESFTRKMFLRNLLNINSVDRIASLQLFLPFVADDWEQYELVKALNDGNYYQEASELLATLYEQDKKKIWVALNYSKALVQLDKVDAASEVLNQTAQLIQGNEKQTLRNYMALLEKRKFFEKNRPQAIVANVEHTPVSNKLKRSTASVDFVDYEVSKGEVLVDISKKFYGTEYKWQVIQKHNKPYLDNPRNIPVGTKIKVPISP